MRNTIKIFSGGMAAAALTMALAATSAVAGSVPPGLLVVNAGSNTLTSYPLPANGDEKPAATVGADGTPSLSSPNGLAVDSAGDAWVTNFNGSKVVEYSKAQLAAGGNPAPIATITATNGSLDEPTGAAFDPVGDLWVANSASSTVVEYTPSQLAAGGAQTPTVTLSSDSSSSLHTPYYLAFDAAGNLWVPNFGGNTLVEFRRDQLTATGSPTPEATISTDTAKDLNEPASITFDAAGDLWTANTKSNRVLEYTPSELTTGAPTPARTLAATFPAQAKFDSAGDLWVAEVTSNSLIEFDAAQVAAGGSPSPADLIAGGNTGLNAPANLVVEQAPTVSSLAVNGAPSGTQVAISGTGFYPGATVEFGGTPAASVKYLSPYQLTAVAPPGSGTVDVTVTTGFGSSSSSPADRFTYSPVPSIPPTLVAANDGPGTLTSFPLTSSGNVNPAATLSDSPGSISQPIDTALDEAGDLWVPSNAAKKVVEYTKAQLVAGGNQTAAVTINSDPAGSLDGPSGAAFDAAGNLWVTNSGNSTVVEYTKAELATGGPQVPAVTLKTDAANSLGGPIGLGFDAAGNLWVSNFGGNTVVEYAKGQLGADGAPTPAVTLSDDGSNSLNTPDALTFDRHGDLWVTNGEGANSLVEFTPNQFATGTPTPAVTITSNGAGSLNGSDQAQFDAAGDLWVANFSPVGNTPSIVEFTPAQLAASGSPNPVDTIGGDATGLGFPWGLVLEQAPTVSSVSPGGGPAAGGTSVTISGTGFYPGSTVDFGSAPASSVTYMSPYQLSAVAPAGTGTVDVTVTTGEGTSAASPADHFAYAAAASAAGSPPSSSPVPATALVPRIGSASRQLKVTGHLTAAPLICSVTTCQGTVRLTQRVVVTVRHGKHRVRQVRTIVLASAHYTLNAGQHRVVQLRLSAATLTALTHARFRRLSVGLVVTVSGGTTLDENVVLFEPAKRVKHTG